MRLLLLNNNPAVSRLIKLSAEKAGYELDEFEDYGLVPLSHYDIILIDNELYDENALAGLREYTGCNYVVYICQRGSKKPEAVNVVLEKPFLPTDFLMLLEKLKAVIESHKAEEENNAEDSSMQAPSKSTDEQSEAFDIDQIDTLEDEDNMLPINLLEENEDDFEEEKSGEKLSFDDLELDDLSFDSELSEGKIPEEKELSSDDEFSFDEIDSFDKEDDVSTLDDFDFEEAPKSVVPSLDEEMTESDASEEEIHNPSVLDKDDIDEVKQLLDESEEEDQKEIDDLSLDALNIDKDDAGTFFLDDDEKEEERPFAKEDESLELDLEDVSDLTFEEIPEEDEETLEEELPMSVEKEEDTEEMQEEIIDDFTEEIDEKIEEEKEQALEEEALLPHADVAIDALDEIEEGIDSLDDLNENMLKEAFGEEVDEEVPAPLVAPAQKNQDIEVIRDEIESSIARSISSLAQSDILREALKGMRLNISITFDEKE